ncbi:ABC transporter ATP-binding protein, partial [Rhizobium sp.]|uniref:ABC transporter ATP-binding protein n=1 Tax=Rhizobium sp. TaxID=391 RepID=UPI000E86BD27|nr:Fe3+/spermidine/putrescine ABC transporter ATP-binding protein [Rhizobium sp.]
PHQLSGGQQQRVAVARAIIAEPHLLLLDEPLSALDRKMRSHLQIELKDLQRRLGIAFVYVTHDQEEAFALSDLIVVMNRGRIVQRDDPATLYARPANAFVADFIGSATLISGAIVGLADGAACTSLQTPLGTLQAPCVEGLSVGEPAVFVLRPDQVQVVELSTSPHHQNITATVRHIVFKGDHYLIEAEAAGILLAFEGKQPLNPGDEVALRIDQPSCFITRADT